MSSAADRIPAGVGAVAGAGAGAGAVAPKRKRTEHAASAARRAKQNETRGTIDDRLAAAGVWCIVPTQSGGTGNEYKRVTTTPPANPHLQNDGAQLVTVLRLQLVPVLADLGVERVGREVVQGRGRLRCTGRRQKLHAYRPRRLRLGRVFVVVVVVGTHPCYSMLCIHKYFSQYIPENSRGCDRRRETRETETETEASALCI